MGCLFGLWVVVVVVCFRLGLFLFSFYFGVLLVFSGWLFLFGWFGCVLIGLGLLVWIWLL